ncbi:hypothetical protein lbkm_0393 [Lachnospiraceae bacterium KM106-2]|nr:hypothetical protein lbkm_0393 [Lachnospiraceae bacterium KM106-2]
MEILAYMIRCIIMFLVTWTGVRLSGKKSVSNMTTYELAAMMLLTTVAAEPLVYKISSKATIGVATITAITILIGSLSLKKFFYNFDTEPIVLIINGKILKKELKKTRMNIPLLMSELRTMGYPNLSEIAYAILEPNGKLSAIPMSQKRPVQPSDMAINTKPVNISFPVIIDGELRKKNLSFFKKDESWLLSQLKNAGANSFKDVLFAQIDSEGNLFVDLQNTNETYPSLD